MFVLETRNGADRKVHLSTRNKSLICFHSKFLVTIYPTPYLTQGQAVGTEMQFYNMASCKIFWRNVSKGSSVYSAWVVPTVSRGIWKL